MWLLSSRRSPTSEAAREWNRSYNPGLMDLHTGIKPFVSIGYFLSTPWKQELVVHLQGSKNWLISGISVNTQYLLSKWTDRRINGTNPSGIGKDECSQCAAQLCDRHPLPVCRAPKKQWKVCRGLSSLGNIYLVNIQWASSIWRPGI